MVRVPPPLQRAGFFLGGVWLFSGWLFNVGVWVTGLVFAALYAVIVGRMYTNVTLQPWSKERGIVVWAYLRKHMPRVEPRLVWDNSQQTSNAPEAQADAPVETPAVPAEVPASPAATPDDRRENAALPSRPLPFPPHPGTATPSISSPASAPPDSGRKICPDCAEKVMSAARVCRYCGFRFEPAPSREPGLSSG